VGVVGAIDSLNPYLTNLTVRRSRFSPA
jgi:hypothetical protein